MGKNLLVEMDRTIKYWSYQNRSHNAIKQSQNQSKCCLGPEERGVHHGEPSRPLPVCVPGRAPAPRSLQPRAELPAQHLQVARLDT